jgi:Tfp pilus assembly protein PilZ
MPNDPAGPDGALTGTREGLRKWVPDTRGGRQVGVVVNVSTGGLFVQSSLLLPVGAALRVALFLPLAAGPKPLATAAWVRWINDPLAPKAITLPPGMGIEFLGLDSSARADLDAFVSERLTGGTETH